MKFLKDFRVQHGYSREQMAQKLDISLSLYDKVEFDARTPSKNFLNRFKKVFPDFDMNIFFEQILHE